MAKWIGQRCGVGVRDSLGLVTGEMRVLLVSGSLREGSTNTALLKTVGVVAPSGVTTVLYRGIATLPSLQSRR